MTTATVSTKGQVTIPRHLRERLGLKAGDKLDFLEDGGEIRIRKQVDPAALDKWRGYLKHLKGRRSDDVVRELRGD